MHHADGYGQAIQERGLTMATISTSIRLTEELHAAVTAAAEKEGVTVTEAMRRFLEAWTAGLIELPQRRLIIRPKEEE